MRGPAVRATTTVVAAMAAWLSIASPASADGELFVVAHPGVEIDSISADDLRLMYMGKKKRWPDDTPVALTVIKSGPVHKSFVTELLQRTPSKFNNYWKQMVFTGKGRPPEAFSDEEALLGYLRETPGTIGYVSDQVPLDGVRKLIVQ